MGRQTRSGYRQTTPVGQIEGKEADTTKRTRFYDAFDTKVTGQSLRALCKHHHIGESTGRYWLRQRQILGSPAYRHTRQLSTHLGQPLKVTDAQLRRLLDDKTNPVRDEPLSVQIAHHNLNISERQLQNRLRAFHAQMYKAVYVRDELSQRVKDLRQAYGQKHKNQTIDSYWKSIVFTDEFHLDPSQQRAPQILRREGTRNELQNIATRPPKTGIILHCAGWVNWYAKCEKLEFYNDEAVQHVVEEAQEAAEEVAKETANTATSKATTAQPRRRPTTESETEYQDRLRQWKTAVTPRAPQINAKPVGNSMTQAYYTERLLPVYISAIQRLEILYPGQQFYLQEDGDPSHGLKKYGPAQRVRDAANVRTHQHPPYSPDMNPIEAAWSILKQRLRQIRRLQHMDINKLKSTVQRVWSDITIEQIQERISDLPERCRILCANGGNRIKGSKW